MNAMIRQEIFDYLWDNLTQLYGDLDNDEGFEINGNWFSVKAIAELISNAEMDCGGSKWA